MMVAAGGDERGPCPVSLRQGESEDVAIESQRPIEVGDLEMNVPDANVRMNRHFYESASTFFRLREIRNLVIRRRSTSSTSTARSSTSKVSPTYGIRPRCDNR